MKQIIAMVLCGWLAGNALALTETRYLDLESTSTPRLDALQASAKTFRWIITKGGTNWDGTDSYPWMYVAPNPTNSGIITAACTWVSITGGVFDCAFSSTDLNTNGLGWIYGVGVTSNAVTVFKQGSFLLRPDPYAAGVQGVNFVTNFNFSLLGNCVGAINGFAIDNILISTTGNTAVANAALATSTNAVAIAAQATNTVQIINTNLEARIVADVGAVSNYVNSQYSASTNFATMITTGVVGFVQLQRTMDNDITRSNELALSSLIPPITVAVDRTTNVVSVLTNLLVTGSLVPDVSGYYTQGAPLGPALRWYLGTNSYIQDTNAGGTWKIDEIQTSAIWRCFTNTSKADGIYPFYSGPAEGTATVVSLYSTNFNYTTNSVIISSNNLPATSFNPVNLDPVNTRIDNLTRDLVVNTWLDQSLSSLSVRGMNEGFVDRFQDQTGINTSTSSNQFYNGAKYFSPSSYTALGGTVTTNVGYTIHSFASSGAFLVTNNVGFSLESLFVLGGGGGGGGGRNTGYGGGGGGAGGYVFTQAVAVIASNYTVTVGTGGAGGPYNPSSAKYGTNGGSSAFGSITATGGGGGAPDDGTGSTGGSGGGGGGANGSGGSVTSGQGNSGGAGYNVAERGGGGGGFGSVGAAGTSGNGGTGQTNYITGSSVMYAAGGAGGGSTGGTGGSGIGGNGGGNGAAGTAGTASRGAGGGGSGNGASSGNERGGDGGSGVVILRYVAPPANMTLISTNWPVTSKPTRANVSILESDTNMTINTDMIAYLSIDKGTNWNTLTLYRGSTLATNYTALSGTLTNFTGNGSNLVMKVNTFNNKNFSLYGWSVIVSY